MLPLGAHEIPGLERPVVQKERQLRRGDARKGRDLGTDGPVEDSAVLQGLARLGENRRERRAVLHEPGHARLTVEPNRRRSQRPRQDRVAPEDRGRPRGEDEGLQGRGSLERQLRAGRPQPDEERPRLGVQPAPAGESDRPGHEDTDGPSHGDDGAPFEPKGVEEVGPRGKVDPIAVADDQGSTGRTREGGTVESGAGNSAVVVCGDESRLEGGQVDGVQRQAAR